MKDRTIALTGILFLLASSGAAQSVDPIAYFRDADAAGAVTPDDPAESVGALPAQDDGWVIAVAPYLWAVNVGGTLEVRGNTADFDINFDDILKDLNFGAMGHVEAGKGAWSFFVEPVYALLESDAQIGPADVDVTTEMLLTDFGIYRRFGPRALGGRESWALDAMLGGRYYYLDGKIDFATLPSVDSSKDWVDLIVGGRYVKALGEKFQLLLASDIGGFDFGTSSQLAWNATGLLGWELGKSGVLWLGYRSLDVDNNSSANAEIDVQLRGPVLGFEFRL